MLVGEVLTRYHALVPFPWTLPKISKAGYQPTQFFLNLGKELSHCDDIHTTTGEKALTAINELRDSVSPH